MITTHPKFEFIPGTQRARMVGPMVFNYRGHTIIVPENFETDFASVPRVFWNIIPATDPAIRPGSIPHDFGYQHGFMLAIHNPSYVYPREAMELRRKFPERMKKYVPVFVNQDQAFFDAMFRTVNLSENKTKIGRIKIEVAHAVLWCAGFIAWDRYRVKGPGAYNQNSLWLPGA